MFESILYKSGVASGPLIDVGALAEALLFYGRVSIVGNAAIIKELLARVPPYLLLSLLKHGRIQFYYLGDQIGVSALPISNGRPLYNLIRFSSPDHAIENFAPKAFLHATGSTGQAKMGARQFSKLLRSFDHSGFDQHSILEALSDREFAEKSVEGIVRLAVPDYKQAAPIRFRTDRQDGGLYVDTNLEFDRLNDCYHRIVPVSQSSFSEAYILALLQGAYEATFFAGTLQADVAIGPIESVVQASAIQAAVRRYRQNQTQIESFMELTLENGHAVREAVNSGKVSFAAVVELLDSADKFRHWLRDQPADANLIQAFYKDTIKNTWAEKLPTKTLRWAIFTGLGLTADSFGAGGIGTATGLALSAVDSFLVDKLVKGWKPHQFVEGELRSLLVNGNHQESGRKNDG